MKKDPPRGNDYGIGAVARMTGLSTQVIRAWERRYGAVVARRADNGRRIYDAADVEKLTLLKALTERGSAIGGVAGLDIETLRERAAEMDQIATRPLPSELRVAVLGAFLPRLVAEEAAQGRPFDIVAADADPARFAADTRQLAPDVLVIEAAHLDEAVLERIHELRRDSGARQLVVAYGFGRSRHERALVDQGACLLKTPVSAGELSVAILAAAAAIGASRPSGQASAPTKTPARPKETGALPPRRYSQDQLSRLARIETDVDCECPRHVAEILKTLTAFEVYSAECESRDEKDAALHAYLHHCSAQARAIMEEALDRLVEVEAIDL